MKCQLPSSDLFWPSSSCAGRHPNQIPSGISGSSSSAYPHFWPPSLPGTLPASAHPRSPQWGEVSEQQGVHFSRHELDASILEELNGVLGVMRACQIRPEEVVAFRVVLIKKGNESLDNTVLPVHFAIDVAVFWQEEWLRVASLADRYPHQQLLGELLLGLEFHTWWRVLLVLGVKEGVSRHLVSLESKIRLIIHDELNGRRGRAEIANELSACCLLPLFQLWAKLRTPDSLVRLHASFPQDPADIRPVNIHFLSKFPRGDTLLVTCGLNELGLLSLRHLHSWSSTSWLPLGGVVPLHRCTGPVDGGPGHSHLQKMFHSI